MRKIWFEEAWEDYLYWQTQDKKTLKRINALIRDVERDLIMVLANRKDSSTARLACGAAASTR